METKKILVVDDEQSLREICQDSLEDAGYEVELAEDGEQALQILGKGGFDLVLSDLRMPNMDGLELLDRISNAQIDVDFLIMTGFGTIETAVESMKKGAADYLPKPFNIGHLLLKVEKVLKQRQARAEQKKLSSLVRMLNMSSALNRHLVLEDLLREFLFHIQKNFSPDSTFLHLVEPIGSKEGHNILQGKLLSDRSLLKLVQKLAKYVLKSQKSKLLDQYNINSDPDLKSEFKNNFPYSMMIVPLVYHRHKIGVVSLLRSSDKPIFDMNQLQLLAVFSSHTASSIQNARLYSEVRNLNMEIIRSYAQAVEAKDIYTRGHSERVAIYASKLGIELGLSAQEIEDLHIAGILHDIGKIGIPDHILNKPSRLTHDEYEVMKKHPVVGQSILSQIGSLKNVLPIVFHHHERFDGHGYPDGMQAQSIPFLAQITSVVDSYEAMTSDRAYRNAMPYSKVKSIFEEGAGSQWNSLLVEKWLRLVERKNFFQDDPGLKALISNSN